MMNNLPLKDLSIEEKLQTMELLWDELCKHEAAIPSPAWHAEVLADRAKLVSGGDHTFEEWETAKQKLRTEVQ